MLIMIINVITYHLLANQIWVRLNIRNCTRVELSMININQKIQMV